MREPTFNDKPLSQAPVDGLRLIVCGEAYIFPEFDLPPGVEEDVGRRYAAILLKERGS